MTGGVMIGKPVIGATGAAGKVEARGGGSANTGANAGGSGDASPLPLRSWPLQRWSITTFFTLGAVFSAQGELFGVQELPMRGGFRQGHDVWQNRDDPRFAAAGAAFRQITRTAFLAALLSFFLASGAAAFVTRLLTRPLAALTDGARRLAAGERGLRLELPSSQDELRVLTEAFNGLTEGLERQEAWRRNLVADIAHDLRTPLAVMRSELEAMQDGVVTLDQTGLARLHTEVLRLSKLVDDLRTLSLAESGGLALRLEPTPLKPLLEETLEAFSTRARQVGVTLTLETMPGTLTADLDRAQIGRVLGNLLDNALRYAALGPVEVGAARTEAGARVWGARPRAGAASRNLGTSF